MKKHQAIFLLLVICGLFFVQLVEAGASRTAENRHLKNLRQLTSGGSNAEAYFSWDGKRIIFQSSREGYKCDQIFTMKTDGSDVRLVSTGKGRTTCSFFMPGDKEIIYSSTHLQGEACPPRPDRSKGYVWALYDFDIFIANADGTNLRRLTRNPAYDAELEGVNPDGTILFTSHRDGNLDLYTMDREGKNLRRLTRKPGYNGGAFFSWDGKKIVHRAYHPKTPKELADFRKLLAQGLIRPKRAELIVMDQDGKNKRQITQNGAANWAPSFHPNGRQIIFSSNLNAPGTRNFDLYLINIDGTGLERVTFGVFNIVPIFSRDGKKILFASDRNAKSRREFNIFIAQWVP
jgi:Tol biopolymer transport system component